MAARVATAAESVACERTTIATGITARDLMQRAGHEAAAAIAARFPLECWHQVAILVGPGNNGGDGWVVAGVLAMSGYRVEVVEAGEARSPDAVDARERAIEIAADAPGAITIANAPGACPLIIDALLGTGSAGVPRGNIASMIAAIAAARAAGAQVISLDVPSGLDATTGDASGAVTADITLALGTMKRGMLLAREFCGEILVLDIGLIDGDVAASLPLLIDREWTGTRIPNIPRTAHKGTRKRLAVIGGGEGMAGAAILAGRGALRSGIGLLHLVVARQNVAAVHAAIPEALAGVWPDEATEIASLASLSDAIAIGPGLGCSPRSRDLVERLLLACDGPVVLDADALNMFADDTASLAILLNGRSAIITPHPAELGRLLGASTGEVLQHRFDVATNLSHQLGAAVLVKGTPTIIFAPDGDRYVVASGTAALATGGSGDVLTGICATLLSQMESASAAAACAAFIHGRAAELCVNVRGVTLDDVLMAMSSAWNETAPSPQPGVITRLHAPI